MKKFLTNVLAVWVAIFLLIAVGFMLITLTVSLFDKDKDQSIKSNSVLSIDLSSSFVDSPTENSGFSFSLGNKKETYFLDVLKSIENAKTDDNIEGICLLIDNGAPKGISQMELLRNRISEFKQSGKFVYAYTNRAMQPNYYLASVADSIFHNPLGTIEWKGLDSQVMFYKGLGEKYGIDFQVIRHGKYKAAVEPFIRTNLSEENKEQISEILNQIWAKMVNNVSASRNISAENLNSYADSLYAYRSLEALNHKMVDVLAHRSDFDNFIKNKLNIDEDEDLKYLTIQKYAQSLKSDYSKDKIAILYAHGAIMPGDGNSGIQAERYIKTIKKLTDDEKIKAVVLRVNSPGGDANASDEILNEIKKLHKKKPVIVSFGDVAASGGYYIAQENDGLLAEDFTITGSIGVLGMIPNVKKLTQNIGITTDHVQTNANSLYYSPFTGLTPQAQSILTASTEDVYERFVGIVAEGRNKTFEQIDSLGGGRVYTGGKAVELGLVDQIGTLQNAIDLAAQKADVEKYQIKSYPKKDDDLQSLMKELNLNETVAQQIINTQDQELLELYSDLQAIRKMKGVQMWTPLNLKIK